MLEPDIDSTGQIGLITKKAIAEKEFLIKNTSIDFSFNSEFRMRNLYLVTFFNWKG